MKTKSRFARPANGRSMSRFAGGCAVGLLLALGATRARAADSSGLTPEQMYEGGTNSYKNWVELSAGGLMTTGNRAEAQELLHLNHGAFGGIEDLHVRERVATNTTLTIDGHSIYGNHDYAVGLKLTRDNIGFVQFNFEQFRTWYNGAGGYFPPTGRQYRLPDDVLALDRGEITLIAGLRKPGLPKITFTYDHRTRDGEKSSTIWGPTHPEPGANPAEVRGLAPSFYDIDETVDTFTLDVSHHIKSTDFGGGLSYQVADLNDARKTTFWPGEPAQQKLTDREKTSYGQLSAHGFSETWFNDKLYFSAGLLYSHLDSDLSGSRIYGNDFDVGYTPGLLDQLGYYNLDGYMRENDYVMDMNLMALPLRQFTIVPSIRVQKEDWNADSLGIGTLGNDSQPFTARSDRSVVDVTEALDLRYTGVTNWVFYGHGEWTEGDGNLFETNGLTQVNGIGIPPVEAKQDDHRLFQKYSVGARWYPLYRFAVNVGGYYKNNRYNYDNVIDSTPNLPGSLNTYPAFLVMQGFETYDGNCRLTFRPLPNLSFIGRYEYQLSTIDTRPDPASQLAETQSSKMTTHILGLNLSWTPWSRLYLQPGFNYVVSETKTPASQYTQAVLNSQNNYWTADAAAGLVLDNKTDLNVSYFYYQSDDYADNAQFGVPVGAGAREHGVTATLTRRISPRLRWNLRYGYYNYADDSAGGNNDFAAHVIFSSVQYRF